MTDPNDLPMPSLAWFKSVRNEVTRLDRSLTRDFAILANLPASRSAMLTFLDEHFPLADGQKWSELPIEDVPARLAEWKAAS